MTESAAKDATAKLAALGFEEALAELETIVQKLEGGDVKLEDSIAIYARGEDLKKHCEALLAKAEARIEKIRLDDAGNIAGAEPLDAD